MTTFAADEKPCRNCHYRVVWGPTGASSTEHPELFEWFCRHPQRQMGDEWTNTPAPADLTCEDWEGLV